MKSMRSIGLLLTLFLLLAVPLTALAGGILTDRVIFGDNFTLASGETLSGNLVVLGGNVTLEIGSRVTRDVVVMGGNLSAAGDIDGSVIGLGGLITLEDEANVGGDVTVIGGTLDQAEGARIDGNVTSNDGGPFTLTFPGGVDIPGSRVNFRPFAGLFGFTWFIFKILAWAALAVLVVLFAPTYTERVTQTAVSQPLLSGGLGLLTVVVLIPALIILAITILLLPVSIAVAAAAVLAWAFGLLALGLELGRRLAEALKQDWAPALSAGVGTFLLMLVLNGADALVPCVGWVFPFLAGIVGLGAVILTRFGMQPYAPMGGVLQAGPPPVSPVVPVVPEPPADQPQPPIPPSEYDPLADFPETPAGETSGDDPGESGGPEG